MTNILIPNWPNVSTYEAQYKDILENCVYDHVERNDRTGVGCYSTFNASLSISLLNGFPLLTGRKMFEKTFKTEFDWFIKGETNIQRFRDAGVKIWDAWADENGDLGPVYGHQMRNFNDQNIDQMQMLIKNLIANPDGRRHIISLWNPAQLDQMRLPPCYLYFQFFTNGEHLNMFVVQRSGDLFLGIPYDMALFSQILLYVAEKTGYIADQLDVQIVDAHIYKTSLSAAKEYMQQQTYLSPEYKYKNGQLSIINYKHGPVISAKVAI
jgi:thymidylate synthase